MDLKHMKKIVEEYQAKYKEALAVVNASSDAKEEFDAYCSRLQLQANSCVGQNSNFDFAYLKRIGALEHFEALLDGIRHVQEKQEEERKEKNQRLKMQNQVP
jgi:hypothetical protein